MNKSVVTVLLVALSTCAIGGATIGKPFKIPLDDKGTYTVLDVSRSGFMRTIVTKRDGQSGVSFSKREYNCNTSKVRYIGTGDTIEDMKKSKPDQKMSNVVDGSISSYIGGVACE